MTYPVKSLVTASISLYSEPTVQRSSQETGPREGDLMTEYEQISVSGVCSVTLMSKVGPETLCTRIPVPMRRSEALAALRPMVAAVSTTGVGQPSHAIGVGRQTGDCTGLHHVRIIEMSGAGVLGRPPPSRTPFSCAGLRATSHTNRSFIWPMNMGSLPQWLLPTYRLERLTGSGKRIDDVVATLAPFQ